MYTAREGSLVLYKVKFKKKSEKASMPVLV